MSDSRTVPLFRAAHGRSGDKGNRSNISVIAWHPEFFALIENQITASVVGQLFAYRLPSRVDRFVLPTLNAMNFVLDDVLDGGVNESLNLDSHGKTLSFLLMELPLEVPLSLCPLLVGPD